MARQGTYRKVRVLVLDGLDHVVTEVYGYELPILIHAHGGLTEKVRLLEDLGSHEAPPPSEEYERMRQRYGKAEAGGRVVDEVYAGGDLAFHQHMADGDVVVKGLVKRDEARLSADLPEGVKVQPKAGDDDYLDKKELGVMLEGLTGEPVNVKTVRRNSLRARVIIAVEEAMHEAKLPIPLLETDPDIGRAFEALGNHKASGRGEG